MSKTLEQTIHEAELPAPAPGGEDFNSYIARVAHAAAFIGAAWAISNGPQVTGPQPDSTPVDEPYEQQPSQDAPPRPEATLVPEGTYPPPVQPGAVQRSDDPAVPHQH